MTISNEFSSIGKRISYFAQKIGGGAELARRSGLSQSTLSRIIRDRESSMSNVLKAIEVLESEGATLEWIFRGIGSPDGLPDAVKTDHIIKIPVYGYTEADTEESDYECPVLFSNTYFRNTISRTPHQCYAYQNMDADNPSKTKGTWCVVDAAIKEGDGTYLIKIQNALQVRRVQFLPTGELSISTHADTYKDYILKGEQIALVEIIGRVVWFEAH